MQCKVFNRKWGQIGIKMVRNGYNSTNIRSMGILGIDLDSAIQMLKLTFLKNFKNILPTMQINVFNRKWGQNRHLNGMKKQ